MVRTALSFYAEAGNTFADLGSPNSIDAVWIPTRCIDIECILRLRARAIRPSSLGRRRLAVTVSACVVPTLRVSGVSPLEVPRVNSGRVAGLKDQYSAVGDA
jgi:hypothetical protein